jgi:UDP-N-acetylmuramyl tripeptide synthase
MNNGNFNAYNALAAYTVLRELGLNDESIRIGFESYTSDMFHLYLMLRTEIL